MSEMTTDLVLTTVRRSASIAAIAAALAKAQGEIEGAAKGKVNPHFKTKYADLASGWESCREQLSKNGLAVTQLPSANGAAVTVTTVLMHSSGEWIESDLTMTAAQNTPQGIGSCLTYARRYALFSIVGIAPEDDDANEATRPTVTERPTAKTVMIPSGYDEWLTDLKAVADEGHDALLKAVAESRADHKDRLRSERATWKALEERAKKPVKPGAAA